MPKPKVPSWRYQVTDRPDPVDVYGRTKLAGEPSGDHVLTIRTSFVGLEGGLAAWLAEQRGTVQGYANSYWTGTSVQTLADVLVKAAEDQLTGLHHAASAEKVSKSWLLTELVRLLGLDVKIESVDEPRIDRALEATIELPPLETALQRLVS